MAMRPKTSSNEITFSKYPDRGCDVSPSCFTCPLPSCKYDDYTAYLKWMWTKRRAPIQAALETTTVQKTAEQFGVTERTVYRVKAKIKGDGQ